MEISAINPCVSPEWDRLVNSHPEATFFHGSPWARVLCATYRHEPSYLKLSDRGNLLALLPLMSVRSWLTGLRGVSLPFTDSCGPLLFQSCNFKSMIPSIFEFARSRRWKYLEVRSRMSDSPASLEFHGHSLDLRPGLERLLACMHSSIRQGIRKAIESGVSVTIDRSPEAMRDFYRLHIRTRRRHGVPPQPYRFFHNILREVLVPGAGFIATARLAGRPIAASVFFRKGDAAIYKFGASDSANQRHRANTLVMWRAIEALVAEGAERLDFGRTSMQNAGLRRFKSQWGSQETRLSYERFDIMTGANLPTADKASGWHNRYFNALPLSMNRLAGMFLYPHLD